MHKTEYHIPRLDCPAEEQMIRLALKELDGIRELRFDLNERRLTVFHSSGTDEMTERLVGLKLGARLVETAEVSDSELSAVDQASDPAGEARVLWILLAINGLMFVVELVAGWLVESTGLIADSLDMLADAAVYGISLYAVGKAAAYQVRAAHISGWFQMALALGAMAEVIRRFVFGSSPEPPYMIGVAVVALIANVACVWLIAKHRDRGAHMKASWIFSTNDVIANLGVIVTGVLVSVTSSRHPDLVIGAVISMVVLVGAVRILRLR